MDRNLPLTEIKPENVINRIKGTAENPRTIERVPAGAEFDLLITFKILESDDEKLFDLLLKGLKLLEMDALGGNTSRGYGRINIELENEELKNKFKTLNAFA
jgi:CRISPR-associated protein Csm3